MKKTIIASGASALTIFGLVAAFMGGGIGPLFNMAHADNSPCMAGGNLSYDQAVDAIAAGTLKIDRYANLTTNTVTATVTNNTACSVSVSLGTYKMFGPYDLATQSEQEFFAGTETW